MSKQELLELVAPLSMEERRELRELLDGLPVPSNAAELEDDPMMKIIRELEAAPPANLPRDFAINHDYYLHGGNKREDLEP